MEIEISSNCMGSQELSNELQKELASWGLPDASLHLVKNQAVGRDIDPFVLWFVTTAASAAITVAVEKIADWWLKKKEGKKLVIMSEKHSVTIDGSADYSEVRIKEDGETIDIRLIK